MKGPKGIELANEFQLLEPENFRDGRSKKIGRNHFTFYSRSRDSKI